MIKGHPLPPLLVWVAWCTRCGYVVTAEPTKRRALGVTTDCHCLFEHGKRPKIRAARFAPVGSP